MERAIAKFDAWTPTQIAALVLGVWWIGNGVAVFLAEPAGASLDSGSAVRTLGLSIAVNGWHGLFHLATGLAGVAACWWPKSGRALRWSSAPSTSPRPAGASSTAPPSSA